MSVPIYVGRFAPTPSGPLHFGSLVAALGSCLEARVRGGRWLMRMEDVDPPRVIPGAADAILRSLEAHGFQWDGPVFWQSARDAAYRDTLVRLMQAGRLYGCTCSRKTQAGIARLGVDGPVYPGTCRGRPPAEGEAWRFQAGNERISFRDALQGRVACNLAAEGGDFVLRRADGVIAYQLAVVVDDADQGVTHVVRGADLLTSTPRQIILQQALGLATPAYLHLPVVLDRAGDKLSKQTLAAPLDDARPLPALKQAARFLGLELGKVENLGEFWRQAEAHWDIACCPPVRGRRLESDHAA